MSDNQENKRVLHLDISDSAARSVMFCYLHARGIEASRPFADEVLRVAQMLSDNPDPENNTYSQTWQQFKGWIRAVASAKEDVRLEDCTVNELEIALNGMGYEVAGVIIRGLAENERDMYAQELKRYRKKLTDDRNTATTV